jgi:hypothetical protein
VIDRRRLLLVALLTIAPVLAACGSLTAPADGPSNPPPADTTARYETKPWG